MKNYHICFLLKHLDQIFKINEEYKNALFNILKFLWSFSIDILISVCIQVLLEIFLWDQC